MSIHDPTDHGLSETHDGSTHDLERLHQYDPPGHDYPFTTPARTTEYVCDGPECTAVFDPAESYNGSFCSEACWYRHRGAKALNKIASDHRWCATCFRQIKTVERPGWNDELTVEGPDHAGRDDQSLKRDCLVGYQYQTEHTTWATDDAADADDHRRLEHQRWGCECGTVDPTTRTGVLQTVDLQTTILSLLACLRHLSDEGVFNASPSWERLRETLRDHGRDWERAVGHALYGD